MKAAFVLAALLSTLPAAETRGKEPSACRESFSMDALVGDIARGRVAAPVVAGLFESSMGDVVTYYDHAATRAGDIAVCDRLQGVPWQLDRHVQYASTGKPASAHWLCRIQYLCGAFTHDLITGAPSYGKSCHEWVAIRTPEYKAHADEICAVMRRDFSDPRKLCAALAPYPRIYPTEWKSKDGRTHREYDCLTLHRAYVGDASACAYQQTQGAANDAYDPDCMDYVRFGNAARAKDPRLCGGSEFCLLMLERPADVLAPYAARVRERYCGLLAGTEPASGGQRSGR